MPRGSAYAKTSMPVVPQPEFRLRVDANVALHACYGPPMLGQGSANVPSPGLLHAKAWAEAYERIDLQLSPLGLRAIEALGVGAGEIVLDIGCGAGQTLLQLAERVGTEGQVIGIDVAPLLLEIAKRRTEPIS